MNNVKGSKKKCNNQKKDYYSKYKKNNNYYKYQKNNNKHNSNQDRIIKDNNSVIVPKKVVVLSDDIDLLVKQSPISHKFQKSNIVIDVNNDKSIYIQEKNTNSKDKINDKKVIEENNSKIDSNNIIKLLINNKELPIDFTKESKKLRIKAYLKESITFTIIMILLDIIAYFIFDDVNIIKLFDIKVLNILVTIIINFVLLYIISFGIDYLVGEISIKRHNKRKQEGDIYRNSRAK